MNKKNIIIVLSIIIILSFVIWFSVDYFYKKDVEKNKEIDNNLKTNIIDIYKKTATELNTKNSIIKNIISKQTYEKNSSYISSIDNDDIDKLINENENSWKAIKSDYNENTDIMIQDFSTFIYHDKGKKSIIYANEAMNLIKNNEYNTTPYKKLKTIANQTLITRDMMFNCIKGNESLVFSTNQQISDNTPSIKYYGTNTINGLVAIAIEDDGNVTDELLVKDGDDYENKLITFLHNVQLRPYIFIFTTGITNTNDYKTYLIDLGLQLIEYNDCFLAYLIPYESTVNKKIISNEYLDRENYYLYNGICFPMTIISRDNFIQMQWKSF
jgi:hypothetical protein